MGETYGPYRVCELLGLGGMASVHRAELDVDGETHVIALKRLLPELSRDISFVRRFVDEARLGQRLRHANIAKTHEVGCIDNTHFIAIEYVRGPTLLHLLAHAMDTQPMPVFISLHVVTQIARALAYAHNVRDESERPLNLIHRDIAPSNIIVSETGTAKLIDFGVAKTSSAHVRTATGSIIGKLGYVAPEYLRGKLDARADLFSLGVVAYEMFTARRLFDVKDLRTAEALRSCEIVPPSSINPHVPVELDEIVMTALERDPEARYQSAFAMFTALDTLMHESGLEVPDRTVAEWVATEIAELEQVPRQAEPAPVPTSEIEIDIEQAFARVRAPSLNDSTAA